MPEREVSGLTILNGQFLTVPASVENFQDLFLLLVDTGELRCTLLPRTIDRLRATLNIQPAGVTVFQGKQEFWYHLNIEVGKVEKAHVAVVARDMPTWLTADGVLGMNWFRLVEPRVSRMTLDFANQTLGLDFT